MMEAVKEKAAETAEEIKASFESINGVFEKVQGAFLAFTAVLAGGEAFKEMIGSTVNATGESVALGRQLGISASSASQLKVAMGAEFVTQEQVTGANQKITMALKKNESAFTDLGVATRDSNGNFRNSLDIQMDVNEALLKFKEGTDRNVEGVKIYGRGWAEAQATLKMTPEVLEEAKIKADELGLTLGGQNEGSAKRYRSAIQQMGEVFEAVGKVIAEAVMPALSTVGEWFRDNGIEVVSAFRAALFALETAWIVLKGAVTEFVDYLAVEMDMAVTLMKVAGQLMRAAVTPGASMGDAWDKALKDVSAKAKFVAGVIVDDAKATAKEISDALESNAADTTKTKDNGDGDNSGATDEKKQRLLAELAAELAAKKAAWDDDQREHGTFIQFSLQQEKQFWDDNIGRAKEGSANRTEIIRNSNKLASEIDKAAYKDQIDALKESESAFKNNLQGKLAIAIEMQAKIAQAEGAGSPAARKAGADILAPSATSRRSNSPSTRRMSRRTTSWSYRRSTPRSVRLSYSTTWA